jgi:hypothetical protein
MASVEGTLPPAASPFAHILVGQPRHRLEALAEAVISVLDAMDGDPDVEPNGDEQDGSLGEDDFHAPLFARDMGPGCPLSDPAASYY